MTWKAFMSQVTIDAMTSSFKEVNGMALNPHWDAVQKMIDGFLELYPEAEYEFAHVVLSDYNLTDEDIKDAIERVNEIWRTGNHSLKDGTVSRLEATYAFLQFLDCIPEDWRMPGQED